MDINSVTAPIAEFGIVSHAGSYWTGNGWSVFLNDAITFSTCEAAESELPAAVTNEPRAYIVHWCV